MFMYFKSREGKYSFGRSFREFAKARVAKGLFSRRLDFGKNAPAGRRWAIQTSEGPVPAGAVVAK